jgi:purine-binding chemotaxis protein CheW
MSQEHQFCTFYLDGHFFGVEVSKVQEVIGYQEVSRVALAAPVIRGLINLRGQIVTALDLRLRLELPAAPADRAPMNVIVRTDDWPVSLLVDEIGDVIEIGPEHFERAPETLKGTARELIRGACKLPDRLLLILNVEKSVTLT